jgi:hypothetical protein
LQAFHSIGLVIDDCIFFIVFWWLIICGGQFVAQDRIEVCFYVIFGAQIVVIVIIFGSLLGYDFDSRYRVRIVNEVVYTFKCTSSLFKRFILELESERIRINLVTVNFLDDHHFWVKIIGSDDIVI